MNNNSARQTDNNQSSPYDFSTGVRGKHAQAYQRGYQVVVHKIDGTTEVRDFAMPEGSVVLAPDVRAYFPNEEMVNRALRGLIELLPQPVAVA